MVSVAVQPNVSFYEAVPLEFTYLVVTRMPGGVTEGDSGLCCCVPCLSSAIISLGLLILIMDLICPQGCIQSSVAMEPL